MISLFTLGYLFIVGSTFSTVYVSKDGNDNMQCGESLKQSCGTIYFASTLISSVRKTIFIYDGQSSNEINKHHQLNDTYNYHPCLPIEFNTSYDVTITFSKFIKSMNDWYANSVCYNNPSYATNRYQNNYIFAGGYSLTVNNLHIDNYDTNNNPFKIIRNNMSHISCSNCVFENVSYSLKYPSIVAEEYSNLYLTNSTFIDINVKYGEAIQMFTGSATIKHTIFVNSIFETSVINFYDKSQDQTINISQCKFITVSTKNAIISKQVDTLLHINIYDTIFENIILGSIIISNSYFYSTINVNNVFVSTSQISNNNEYGLFFFGLADFVIMENIIVEYSYDFIANCYNKSALHVTDINSSCYYVSCKKPVSLVNNYGHVTLKNTSMTINISMTKYMTYKQSFNGYDELYMEYEQHYSDPLSVKSLIYNHHFMEIYNLYVDGVSFGYNFIGSAGHALIISQMIMNMSSFLGQNAYPFSPNALQSSFIVYHRATTSSVVNISESVFIGSVRQIVIDYGDGYISSSSFQHATRSIDTMGVKELAVTNCTFDRVGRYYGGYRWGDLAIMFISFTNNVYLAHNKFSSFDPSGFIFLNHNDNATLIYNEFSIDYNDLYYNISSSNFNFIFPGLIIIRYGTDISVINNYFNVNNVDSHTPWISYINNTGINCLSGNTFSSFAFALEGTNISSCSRKQLINCFGEKEYCTDGMYGIVDKKIFNSVARFNITTSTTPIFSLGNNYVALDNVEIRIYDDDKNDKLIIIEEGNIFLLDSTIIYNDNNNNSIDMWYDVSSCSVIYNDRLSSNTNYIAKFMIKCNNDSDHTILTSSMHSSKTRLINHFSATKLNVYLNNSLYFPGSPATFDFEIMDKFNNIIDKNEYNFDHGQLILKLESNNLKLSIDMEIDKTGQCTICERGLILLGATIKDTIGEHHYIDISLQNDYLLLTNEQMDLHITGCPTGYGSDTNNYFCEICNPGTYNLFPNNTDKCQPCDLHINHGIECINGNIYVSQNHWIGFEGQNIISSICPPLFCTNKNKFHYISNKQKLCNSQRNHESVLCSQCNRGFSVSMNSTKCVKCEKSYYITYLLLPIGFAFMWSIILIMFNSTSTITRKSTEQANINMFQRLLSNEYFVLMVKIIFIKNIIYYEQAISQILSSNPFNVIFFYSFSSLFNFTMITNTGNENNLWCFIDGLSEKQKILTNLFIPIMITIFILLSYLISKYICIGRIIICKKRKINFSKIFVALFLLIIGTVLEVIFMVLDCHNVGTQTIHFYFAYEGCYGTTWFTAFSILIFIIFLFSVLFMKIKNMNILQRHNPNHALNVFTSKFKPQYYYWEFTLLIRRIIIAMFSVSTGNIMSQFIFVAIMLFFLFIHYECQPFIIHQANKVEFILLASLIFIIMLQFPVSVNPVFIIICTSFLIIIPFLLLAYYIHQFMKSKPIHRNFVLHNLFNARIKFLMLCIVWLYASPNCQNNNKNHSTNIITDTSEIDENDESYETDENETDNVKQVQMAQLKTIHSDSKYHAINAHYQVSHSLSKYSNDNSDESAVDCNDNYYKE